MREKGKAVRLTDKAHVLLTEKAKDLNVSMVKVASEAILSLFKRELKYNEYIARINGLEDELNTVKRYAGKLFVLGTVVSGCVMFFVGVLL